MDKLEDYVEKIKIKTTVSAGEKALKGEQLHA